MTSNKRIIVAGGGRIGTQTARLLHERGHRVVLIEQAAEQIKHLSKEYVATVISGDATRPSVLEQAEPGKADAIAALTAVPGTNLAICLLARQRNQDIYTLARTESERQREYTEHVDSVVLGQQSVASRTVDLLVGGEIRTFTRTNGGFEVLDLVVTEGSSIAGHKLGSVNLPDGCRVIGGLTSGELASLELVFEAGQRYLIAAESETLEDIRMLFQE